MTPDAKDPRWRAVVQGAARFELRDLGARLLVARLRMETLNAPEPVVRAAIDAAHDFFQRNEVRLAHDLTALFGKDPS